MNVFNPVIAHGEKWEYLSNKSMKTKQNKKKKNFNDVIITFIETWAK